MSNEHDHVEESYRHFVVGPKPHVHSVWLYWGVFFTLVLLTLLTVYSADFDMGSFSVAVALLIAGTKASLVMAVFMHLWFDNKLYALIASTSLVFLSLFILFPIVDLGSRGYIEPERDNFLPRDIAVEKYQEANPGAPALRPGQPLSNPTVPDASKLIFLGPGAHE